MAKLEHGVLKTGVHLNWDFSINFWKIFGSLYIIVFCAAAVIGDLILRVISGQGFAETGDSLIWLVFTLIIMGFVGGIMGSLLYSHQQLDPVKGLIIAALIVAVVIVGLFIYDVSYITGKFAAINDNKNISCETNSHWISPLGVTEICRFDDNVSVALPVGGKNLNMNVLIIANGATLYKTFSTQDGLTSYIRTTVNNELSRVPKGFGPVRTVQRMLTMLPNSSKIQWIHEVNLN